jgi:hypothetical protein
VKGKIYSEADMLDHLRPFIRQNNTINLRTIDLNDPEATSQFLWLDLEEKKSFILEALKGYQRLARIIPEENSDTIFALLKRHIHSALHIAAIPRAQFFNTYSNIFDNDREFIEKTYQNALAVRAAIVRHYLAVKQHNEPHIKQTKINK